MNMTRFMPQDYYLNLLPPLAAKAAHEVWWNTQVEPALVLAQFESAMSAAASPLFDVVTPYGQTPTSLWNLTIAESGSSKTRVQKLVAQTLHELAREADHNFVQAKHDFEATRGQWQLEIEELRKEISRENRKRNSTEHLKREREQLMRSPPKEPKLRLPMSRDTDWDSVHAALEGECESVAILLDDGGSFLDGNIKLHLDKLCQIWDGVESLPYNPRGRGSRMAVDPRLTLGLQVQTIVFNDYERRRGAKTRGMGYWARYLVTIIQKDALANPVQLDAPNLAHFQRKVHSLVEAYKRKKELGIGKPHGLLLSTDATGLWYGLKDEVARRKSSDWGQVRDFAEKTVNNATRVAANLHVFGDGFDLDSPKEIPRDTLWHGWQIAEAHMQQARWLFEVPPPPPPAPAPRRKARAEIDAHTVLDCLTTHYANRGRFDVPLDELGLVLGFASKRLQGAMHVLNLHSVIRDSDVVDGRLDIARSFYQARQQLAWS